jgi:hypothetical protein
MVKVCFMAQISKRKATAPVRNSFSWSFVSAARSRAIEVDSGADKHTPKTLAFSNPGHGNNRPITVILRTLGQTGLSTDLLYLFFNFP